MPLRAHVFVALISLAGFASLFDGVVPWHSGNTARFVCCLSAAMFIAGFKIALPGVPGTISATFVFVLFGIAELTLPETLVIATVVTAAQCALEKSRRPRPYQVIFNVANMALAVGLAVRAYHAASSLIPLAALLVAAVTFFVVNTVPVAVVLSAIEKRPLRAIWWDCQFWSFPYYLAGAVLAGLMSAAQRFTGWPAALLLVPLAYLIYRCYSLYLARLRDEKRHSEQIAALHMRTIEALALAIEAKDRGTHAHLRRVQIYAVETAKELKLPAGEIDALRAAALLHDIGKLAVPEHIVSKPGRLTPEEFDKMRIHPIVGAEILDRIQFSGPVVPIVRCHHEKWDGTGYPAGLSGEEIPIGARILSAVDCLDALTSDRQYRCALTLDAAVEQLVAESGRSFDPRVIDVLRRRYRHFQRLAEAGHVRPSLPVVAPPRGASMPGAGFEIVAAGPAADPSGFLDSIVAARQEGQQLFELSRDLGTSLSPDETFSMLALRLRGIVDWDAMAIYIVRNDVLKSEFVSGDEGPLLSSLEIPVGHGLSGWVAANQKPILNGNAGTDLTHRSAATTSDSRLQCALAVPLEGTTGNIGVMALYRNSNATFTKDHLRILLALSSKISLSVENSLRFRQAESSATTDYLTGLPNTRSLFLHLDAELSRARREESPIAVLVCDLDGFKQVNDCYGHLEGNRVLRAVASGLKDACREYDYVARMGGDEFVLILPGLTADAIAGRVEALREAARRAGGEMGASEVLGLSIGESFYPADGEDAEQLLATADRRMYQAKQSSKQRDALRYRLWETETPALPVQ